MAADSPFASVEQGDVAFLERDGIAYRCYVWQRTGELAEGESTVFRGLRVEAAIYVEQPNGESVLLRRAVVRTPPSGEHVDCPRVVAHGSTFAVHWIEYDPLEAEPGTDPVRPGGRDLHRATFDVESAPYAWTHQGSISTSWLHLYDVAQSEGSDGDYLLVHASSVDTVALYRVNGDTWVDTEWVASVGGLSLQQNVLACASNGSHAIAAYQQAGQLYAFSRQWSTGASADGSVAILPSVGEVTAVGMTRISGTAPVSMLLLAEFIEEDVAGSGVDLPATLHCYVETDGLELVGFVRTRNTTLQSKPWHYASTRAAGLPPWHVYAVLGYQAAAPNREWLESSHYVVRYEPQGSERAGRPMPVAALTSGLADAMRHGSTPLAGPGIVNPAQLGDHPRKRRNHLPSATPAPSVGPMQRTSTTFLARFSRIDNAYVGVDEVGVTVAGAAIRATRFHHDTPWRHPVDDADGSLRSEPYFGASVPQLEHESAGAGLFFSGGVGQTYDGHRFVECGFLWAPEIVLADENSEVAGPAAGTRSYVAVYEWRDNRGQTHRSLPSDPVEVATDGASAIELWVRTMTLSPKDNPAFGDSTVGPVIIDIYRTEDGGGIFYPLYRGNAALTYDLADVPQNDPSAGLVHVIDIRSDAEIRVAVPLPYTFIGGAWSPIPGSAPPAMTACASWQNRVWGVSAEEPHRIWFSRELQAEPRGEQYTIPEFSPDLTFRIDGVGTIVAMREMDSSLILFGENAIYALLGAPPDATGQGSTLQLQLLQRGTGCVEPRSVASSHDGIYFQSRRGFYKLTRTNELVFVGAAVEDELRLGGNIRAVTVHEDTHQCRLVQNGGAYDSPRVLVYDWLMDMWAVWPLPRASQTAGLSSVVDAAVWHGHAGEQAHVVLQASGVLVQKPATSPTRYADEAINDDIAAIPVDVRTGWIHLAGLAGFKRVRKVGLHLSKPAASAFTVELEYDIDGTQTDGAHLQTVTFGSPAPAYVEVPCHVQKCTSIRVRIFEGTEEPAGDQLTEATIHIHAITLEVARKPGLARVPSTQKGS